LPSSGSTRCGGRARKAGAGLLEPPPITVSAPAPLEDHTRTRHRTPPLPATSSCFTVGFRHCRWQSLTRMVPADKARRPSQTISDPRPRRQQGSPAKATTARKITTAGNA
jgi:hypothetical protein